MNKKAYLNLLIFLALAVGFIIFFLFFMPRFSLGSLFTAVENDGSRADLTETSALGIYEFNVNLNGDCGSSDWTRSTKFSERFHTSVDSSGRRIKILDDLESDIVTAQDVSIEGLKVVTDRQSEPYLTKYSFGSFKSLTAKCDLSGGSIGVTFEGEINPVSSAEYCIEGDLFARCVFSKDQTPEVVYPIEQESISLPSTQDKPFYIKFWEWLKSLFGGF